MTAKKSTSIVFTGDIGFDRYMGGKWTDKEFLAPEVMEFLHSGDHLVANVEGALIREEDAEDATGKGIFFHTMNPAASEFLKDIKADIWDFANNHTMDAGKGGIVSGMEIAAKMGCRTVGAGRNIAEAAAPVYLDEAGGIGIIAVGFMPICVRATETEAGVFGWDEMDRIAEAVKEVKKTCRWCVIVSHAGEEFTTLPAPYTRDRYRKYLEMGADIVVGHHPHVPMNYERVGDKIIFYSLGNFVFDTDYQRRQYNTDTGLLMKINFTEDAFTFEPFGTHIVRGPQKIEKGPIPAIFENIGEEDYNKLIRMAAKAFMYNERKRAAFLKHERADFTPEQWEEYYNDFTDPYRVKGELLDLTIMSRLEKEADMAEFESCPMEGVRKYILRQIDS